MERAVGVVHADEQGADAPLAPSLACQPAADHELLAPDVLDLDPRRAARARFVGRIEALGDDALELLLGGRLEHVAPAPFEVTGRLPGLAAERERLQQLVALLVVQPDQRMPVEPQEVEDHVSHGRAFGEPFGLRRRADVHAPLQRREARAPVPVEGDDLAVEDRLVRAECAVEPCELGIGPVISFRLRLSRRSSPGVE